MKSCSSHRPLSPSHILSRSLAHSLSSPPSTAFAYHILSALCKGQPHQHLVDPPLVMVM